MIFNISFAYLRMLTKFVQLLNVIHLLVFYKVMAVNLNNVKNLIFNKKIKKNLTSIKLLLSVALYVHIANDYCRLSNMWV